MGFSWTVTHPHHCPPMPTPSIPNPHITDPNTRHPYLLFPRRAPQAHPHPHSRHFPRLRAQGVHRGTSGTHQRPRPRVRGLHLDQPSRAPLRAHDSRRHDLSGHAHWCRRRGQQRTRPPIFIIPLSIFMHHVFAFRPIVYTSSLGLFFSFSNF